MQLSEHILTYSPTQNQAPFIIAEAGVNHEGEMDLAKRLIDEAKEGGADAIKFQTYKAETIASKDSPSYWDTTKESTRSQYELFKKYDKFWKTEFEALKTYCDQADIEFLSTPFDVASATFLNDLMGTFKISSSDLTNRPFIELICSFNKPIVLSTGAAYVWEIQQTFDIIEQHGNPLCLMHCVLNYPTDDQNANLSRIKGIIDNFPTVVPGYSDHTLPKEMDVCAIAYLLGASVIEKHFTHDKTLPGNDHYHAMDKEDLKQLNAKIEQWRLLMGSQKVTALDSEMISRRNARRSLVAAKEIPQGKIIEAADLTWKRPATGISPMHIGDVIGKKAAAVIEEDAIMKWKFIADE